MSPSNASQPFGAALAPVPGHHRLRDREGRQQRLDRHQQVVCRVHLVDQRLMISVSADIITASAETRVAPDPGAYRRHIENRIRAGNTTLP
ncbi:hypothetical protein [Streptomyces sp. 6N223]|uniref:hypothetical protein n=1 Tax=Streptomyces sp. 6N223 TaxID=3457412 RepID=UPI003FD02E4B